MTKPNPDRRPPQQAEPAEAAPWAARPETAAFAPGEGGNEGIHTIGPKNENQGWKHQHSSELIFKDR